MSDQSSMDRGDPLGDRFWLSPKKGKWKTQIGYNMIEEKGGRMIVGIGWMNVYVIKGVATQ